MIFDLTLGRRPSGRGAAFVGGHLNGLSQVLSSIELMVLLVNLTFLLRFILLLLRLLFFFGLFLLPAKMLDFTRGLVLTLAGLRVVVVVGATNSSISSTYSTTSSGIDVFTGI